MKNTYIKNNIIRAAFGYIMQKYGDQEIEVIKSMYDRLKERTRKAETLNYLHKLCYARKDISVIKVAEMLLENEDVNSLDLYERTPLMLAVLTKKKDLVEVLLKNKADVTLFDVNFKMAINYCTENTKEYRLISDALIMANGRRLGLDVSTLTPLEPFTYF
nr:protein lin-12-like [Hydra vulgaris]